MFEEAFPYYLAMGMTYEEFWEKESDLVKFYRKANEIRQEQYNQQAWLQGMYVYEAIADIAPILHAFAKKGTKPRKYSEKPYEFKRPEKKRVPLSKQDRDVKKKSEKIKAMMMAAMHDINKKNTEKRMTAALASIGSVKGQPDGKVAEIAESDTRVTVVGENMREGT